MGVTDVYECSECDHTVLIEKSRNSIINHVMCSCGEFVQMEARDLADAGGDE